MSAIMACRTAALGGHVETCTACRASRIAFNSCRNRHCSKCQDQHGLGGSPPARANSCPCPRNLRPGDVVVMDSLSSPKGAKRASADRDRRSDAALPAALLRQTQGAPAPAERTINGLWAAIGRFIDTFTPSECANYFTPRLRCDVIGY